MTRRRLLLALAALVALAVAFLWGRATTPSTYLETVKVMRVEKTKELSANTKLDATSLALDRVGSSRMWQRKVHDPDGRVTCETSRVDSYGEGVRSESAAQASAIDYRDREVLKTVGKIKLIEAPRPSWHVAALVGLSASPALQTGASLSRRVAGPFSIGAWAVTNPREWKNATAGVSLGMEW